ncbi:9576_t:CDS:2 [Gigaspora margarita]|uniref:9576_t:CDS:1 n=1 Tax=Gigaspora margarita TaxID=4874 RepID=A0ABN7V6Q2_GIGMA|nr:9576_t:CDS:2 [Gigaspora margarita]
MHITEGNELNKKQPGFRCNLGSKFSNIKETSSAAVTSLYNHLFLNSNTRFSGPYILGWDNKDLLDASLEGVEFQPFAFKVEKYLIQIINIGIKSNSDLMGYSINEHKDIEIAIKDIWKTTITNIKPDQKNINKNKPKLPRISNWHQFKYPIEEWALKEMQEYRKWNGRKHMTVHIIELLKSFFYAGNIDKSKRYTAKDMLDALEKKAEVGELETSEVPKLKTIENWIRHYTQQYKKDLAKKA